MRLPVVGAGYGLRVPTQLAPPRPSSAPVGLPFDEAALEAPLPAQREARMISRSEGMRAGVTSGGLRGGGRRARGAADREAPGCGDRDEHDHERERGPADAHRPRARRRARLYARL